MADHHYGGRKNGTGNHTMLGESPCDKCLRGIEYCKQNELACSDYLYYIKKGKIIKRSRVPTTGCYLRMQASGKTKHEQKIRSGQEKGRAKKESGAKKESTKAQISSQKESCKAQSARKEACIINPKIKSIAQILIEESGVITLYQEQIKAHIKALE